MPDANQPGRIETAELRRFGLVLGAAIALVFGALLPWLFDFSYPRWPWIVGGVLAGSALAAPRALAPVYGVWMRLAAALGWFNTRLVLGIVFYGVVLPIGLVMRLIGHDPLARRFDAAAASYRVASKARDRSQLERPF